MENKQIFYSESLGGVAFLIANIEFDMSYKQKCRNSYFYILTYETITLVWFCLYFDFKNQS